ncbi:hypothetical protein [Meridianimaribacter flavus]|uniref:Uncharacterized protein n=1 Tax=Meridianimaribacter flavus TaxID=571115 RepID=A0ABY2G8Y6_9FLAO|nr:hypothetical protein [Meridianimaribacter flavus]TDY13827.1 hypothetical protein A8975_0423 [Meridianimaribacter flavus]
MEPCVSPTHLSQSSIVFETFFEGIINRQLDGLSLQKDSLNLFYSNNALLDYHFKGYHLSEKPNDLFEHLPLIFEEVYAIGARLLDYTSFSIEPKKDAVAYGMLGAATQDFPNGIPTHLYVLVLSGDCVFMTEQDISRQIKELSECKSVLESDKPKCFREYFKTTPLYENVRAQALTLVNRFF